MNKIIIKKETLTAMPVPPSLLFQKGNKYFYVYRLFDEPKKAWKLENVENVEISKDDKIIFENYQLIYNENYLWNIFHSKNIFDNLIIGSPDPVLTYLVAGTIIGNLIEDGKVWLFVIGKASSGKTHTVNLFQSMEKQKLLYYVGKFTSAAFFSVRNYKDSIITQVARGGTIICKDFSSFLARGMGNYYKIMNMLREIYDGFYEDKTVQGTYRWTGKIGMIICGTPSAQRKRAYMYEMGDRFIYYKINSIFQPVLCQSDLGEYIMNNCYDRMLNERGEIMKLKDFPNAYDKDIDLIAQMIEICRTANPLKYRKTRDYIIEPNQHFRLRHQLTTLATAMSIAGGYDSINENIMKMIMELVYRGAIERYHSIIHCLFKEKIKNLKVIKRYYNLSPIVFDLALEDLCNYGLVKVIKDEIYPSDKFQYIYEKY